MTTKDPRGGTAAGYTPGPWEATRIDYPKGLDVSFEVNSADGRIFVAQTVMRDIATEAERIARDEANAHLIAAAPEMYEALKGIMAGFEADVFRRNTDGDANPMWAMKFTPYMKALSLAHQALAKAAGTGWG